MEPAANPFPDFLRVHPPVTEGIDAVGFLERFLRRSLVRAAREIYGPLGPNEQLVFVPALALGGTEDLASVEKVEAWVHQSILQQMG